MADSRSVALNTMGGPRKQPGRPVLHMRPQPGASKLGGKPRYIGHDSSNNRSIVKHFLVRPWSDGSAKLMKPGDLVFVSRTTTKTDKMTTMVNWEKMNLLLRAFYYRSLENWSDKKSSYIPSVNTAFLNSKSFKNYVEKTKYSGLESYQLEKLLSDQEITMYMDPSYLEELREEYNELKEDELEMFESRNIFDQKKDLKGQQGFSYLTKGGILTYWNFLGALNNTDNDTGEQYDPLRRLIVANVVLQKRVRIYNRWTNNLVQGQFLYMILKRVRLSDGTYGEFQIIPWTNTKGNIRAPPSREDLLYGDISGEHQLGKVYFVGSVYERLTESRQQLKRDKSLGLGTTSLREAYEAKGELDYIVILLNV